MQKDFIIQPLGPLSQLSLKLGLRSFQKVCDHLLHLPYRRPSGKTQSSVLTEGCGTCSSKHGVLKAIADEHERGDLELVLCLFRMTASNTPKISEVLANGTLSWIPEAHTYINWDGEKIDITKPGLHISNLKSVVLEERVISLKELSLKLKIHQAWMKDWLYTHHSDVSFKAAWQQREACIAALADC